MGWRKTPRWGMLLSDPSSDNKSCFWALRMWRQLSFQPSNGYLARA
jgi:hypothetical protein